MITTRGRAARAGVLAVALVALLANGPAAMAAEAQTDKAASTHPGGIPGSWIVTLEAGQSPDRVASDHARDRGARVTHVYRYALQGYSARMSDVAAARVARDPRVRTVHADRGVEAYAQTLPTGIDRIDSELSGTASGDGTGSVDVDVAILDTGIDIDHPDLNVVGGKNCSDGTTYDDGNGHGTHVAGSAAALDNGIGVVGVAPGARLWAVRVLDNNGSGSWSSVICGIDWVTGNAGVIDVANLSLGGSSSENASSCGSSSLHQAICNSVGAGITYAVAAGNSAADAKDFVPAMYSEVITVSALADFDGKPGGLGSPTCRSDVDDTFADFSNHGAVVDIIAPGVCIRSTWKGGGYGTMSGTSMASPHAAGAAALYKASAPGASPAQVKAALQDAGTLDWNGVDDKDGIKERLLTVATFGASPSGDTNAAPSASFTYSCDGLACSFNGSASSDPDGTIAGYSWAFGDGTSGSGVTAPHTYASGNTYAVTLTVTDGGGSTGSSSQSVTVAASSGSTTSYSTSTSYAGSGGRTNDKHMDVTVAVTDGTKAVAGATVQVRVFRNGQSVLTATGTSDSTGRVTFTVKNGGPACYTTDVLTVNGVEPSTKSDTGSSAC